MFGYYGFPLCGYHVLCGWVGHIWRMAYFKSRNGYRGVRLTVLTVYRFVSVVSNVFLITTEKARIELLSPIWELEKNQVCSRTCVVIHQFYKFDKKIPRMS